MSSFLIDRNSPIRSVNDLSSTGLHHRSKHSSESDPKPDDSPSHSRKESRDQEGNGDMVNERGESTKGPSMISYFKLELARSYKLEGTASEFVQRRDRIYTSVNTPKSLEKFCAFGLLQCLDSILNIMTFLPLRILAALFHVLTYPCSLLLFKKKTILNPGQVCDLLKGFILLSSCFITSYIDTSMVYHIVRVQSIIKFYVIYNMLDVMDKLISGFGQDVLDSLYWTAVEPRGRKRQHFGTIFHLMFAIAYVVIHTTLILIQAITLNVAFNSQNKNLLTIMLSNNFIEIKANLMKRLDKNSLCQITYGDVKERFHYFVLLLFVFIHNLLEKNWLRDKASVYLVDVLIVLGAEVIVDWIKHSFITKINEFSASYYSDFAIGLARDIASSKKKHAFTDFSDQVCRRMGFTPIPLICLLYMVCRKSFEITGMMSWLMIGMFYLCLFTTKVINSIVLLGWAQHLITLGEKNSKSTVIVGDSQVIPKKEDNKTVKNPKTESISHCPDMTSPVLTQPVLPPDQSVIRNDDTGSCFQSPPSSSFTTEPSLQSLETFSSPSSPATTEDTNPLDSPVLISRKLVEEDLHDTSMLQSSLVNDSNGEHGRFSKNDSPLTAKHSRKDIDDLKDEIAYEQKENKEDEEDDLYEIFLKDVSTDISSKLQDDSLSYLSEPSRISPILNSTSASTHDNSIEEPPIEEAIEPFMLKLSSSLPLQFNQRKDAVSSVSSFENGKEMFPSRPRSSSDTASSSSTVVLSENLNEKCDEADSRSSHSIGNSNTLYKQKNDRVDREDEDTSTSRLSFNEVSDF